eukprot:14361786-Heterocapsa_arctica.AAC.1
MVKATKNKRKSDEITEEALKPEEHPPSWGKTDKGGGRGYGKPEWWTNPSETKSKPQIRTGKGRSRQGALTIYHT